jgi:hypothetical protein
MALIIGILASALLGLVVGAYTVHQVTRESAYAEGWHEGYSDARRPVLAPPTLTTADRPHTIT